MTESTKKARNITGTKVKKLPEIFFTIFAFICVVSFLENIRISANGTAFIPVIISENAGESIKKLVDELVYYL
ncbi:MAG: hypothetical protein NC937_02380 [Candidatus Omnitrophica bacterium]|nr:hypothetical protein [Candidatus Omnitrophota bacterium]